MAIGDQFPWWHSSNWSQLFPLFPDGSYNYFVPHIPLPALPSPKPASPPYGLLISMATRLDHGFGYKQFCLGKSTYETDEELEQRQKALLLDVLRMWEEMNGKGFWSPENNESYERSLSPHVREFLDKRTKGLDFPP